MTMTAQAALSPNIQRPTASCPGPLIAGDISASRADGRAIDSAWNQQLCGRRAFVLLLWVKDQLIAASSCSLGSNRLCLGQSMNGRRLRPNLRPLHVVIQVDLTIGCWSRWPLLAVGYEPPPHSATGSRRQRVANERDGKRLNRHA
jgi:hypothetical protein